MADSKYTDQQLADMAEECLCAYNLGDARANIIIQLLSQVKRMHPEAVVAELNRLCAVCGK